MGPVSIRWLMWLMWPALNPFCTKVGLSVGFLFRAAAAAIVDDNWPGFATNYVDIWLVDNCSIIQLFN